MLNRYYYVVNSNIGNGRELFTSVVYSGDGSRDNTTEKFLPLQPTLPASTRQPPILQSLLQKGQWQLELLDS